MTKRLKHLPLVLGAALCGLTAFAGAASANLVSAQSYHASQCQQEGSGESLERSEYRLTNKSGQDRYVLCPVGVGAFPLAYYSPYMDGASHTIVAYGGTRVVVDVSVTDKHSSKNVSCQLMGRRLDGSTGEIDSASTYGTPSATSLSLEVAMGWNSYVLKCRVPNTEGANYVKLHSYQLRQES